MIPIPQQPQSEHRSIPIMNSQQHQDGFNQPQSAHSERSEWLDVDEEFPPSKPQSASMLHSYSAHSQNSDQISSSEFSSQPFYNHPHQQQHQERMIESQQFHHPNPSSHRVPSVIRQFHPDQNENQDPTDGSERVGPEWNLNLVESSQQQQGPTFSYIDSGSKLAEQQPQLAPVRVSKACVPCRDRRIRCQGGHPHCTSCIEKNRTHLCVYRIIPPRVVTRKALEDLQSRLERAEDQLHQSNDANRELKARLWEADKELEKLKSGEKVRELERHLRELKFKLLGNQSQLSSPNYRQIHGHHYSPSQESNVSFGTAEDVSASPYGSPSFQRHWSSDDQDSQEPFHPNKRPQLDSQARRSPYARPVRTESVSSRHSNSQRTVDVGRVGQGQVGPNRRRAATTSTVGPSASLYTNQQPQGIGHGLNISFDREGDSDLRRGDAHQSFSSQNGHHQGVPRSQSVSSSSSAFSPGYPASPNSLPLPTPPVLELGSGYLTGRPLGSPFKADVQLEPCYLQTPFNDMNSIRHPTSTPLDMAGTRHKYQYIDPKVHYAQERDHHHHDPNQNQKQNQASNHHNHQHQPHQHTSHSHSQSLPSSQFTFKPQFVKHASPQFSPDTSVDSGVNLSEQHRN